jgi:hypothetical protein
MMPAVSGLALHEYVLLAGPYVTVMAPACSESNITVWLTTRTALRPL